MIKHLIFLKILSMTASGSSIKNESISNKKLAVKMHKPITR